MKHTGKLWRNKFYVANIFILNFWSLCPCQSFKKVYNIFFIDLTSQMSQRLIFFKNFNILPFKNYLYNINMQINFSFQCYKFILPTANVLPYNVHVRDVHSINTTIQTMFN